jgi:hypothetical protein
MSVVASDDPGMLEKFGDRADKKVFIRGTDMDDDQVQYAIQ